MQFPDLLARFSDFVERAQYDAFAQLFTVDGIYDDVFYGRFVGRGAIGNMLREHFHGNARSFRWDLHDPVFDGRIGYAHYTFSYESTMRHSAGQRAVFTGAAKFELDDGLIAHYTEWAYGLAGLAQLDTPASVIERQARREAERILTTDRGAQHRDS
ncbi:MAG: nuclear transport factor 2 family protein [Pseudomonadota bacterium]